MKLKVIPTVLAYDLREFKTLFKKVVPLTNEIQIDIMDGRFVTTKSIPLEKIPSVKKYRSKKFEAHLMVKEPLPWVPELVKKGFKRFIFHYEAVFEEDLPLIARFAKKMGIKATLALNPDTPVGKVVPHAHLFDTILFLGVHPGQNAASYVTVTPQRIKEFIQKCGNVRVQVDGGMTPDTINAVVEAGATRINTGSFVGSAKDPKKALQQMYDATR